MMTGGTLLILLKGQGQLQHSICETLWARYKLQFSTIENNNFQISHVRS